MIGLAAVRPRPLSATVPQLLFVPAVLVVAVSVAPAYAFRDGAGTVVDSIQQNAAVLVAVALLARAALGSNGRGRELPFAFAAALVIGAVGVVRWELEPSLSAAPPLTNGCFLAAAGLMVVTSGRAFAHELDRSATRAVVLDATILFLGAATVVMTVWQPDLRDVERARALPAVAAGVALIAGSMVGWLSLLTRRITPGARGPWAVIDGMLMLGLGWLNWIAVAARGESGAVILPGDFLLSLGVLLLAYGTATWDDTGRPSAAFERFASRSRDAFPLVAAVGSVSLQLLVPHAPPGALATTFGIVVAAAVRTALLVRDERAAAARLAWETQERADTLGSIGHLQPAGTAEETAARICAEARQLRGIDVAIVDIVRADGALFVLGASGFDAAPAEMRNRRVPEAEAARLLERATAGPWAETIGPREGDLSQSPLYESGVRGVAAAPLLWEERVIGLLSLGTCSPEMMATLPDRLSTVREFAVVAAALLGPALAERDRRDAARGRIQAIIAEDAFHAVFQPIVELSSGAIVGFEALTRFDDGTRPDIRFGEAAAAGMSVPLEVATLRTALEASQELPDGWLSLNVSPDLAAALLPLVAALEGARRAITLEITEHVAIDDYGRLMRLLGTLRSDVRIAVDDAGAGYAGLRHILEVRPDFVKLDIGLVRSIDTDLARRALVASMVTFARETGCRLIAEGIETAAELATLRELGVELGQGYHLGRPVPAGELEVTPSS